MRKLWAVLCIACILGTSDTSAYNSTVDSDAAGLRHSSLPFDLQVDAGSSGCTYPDSDFQLRCFVLLLLCYGLLWTLVTDIPQKRLGLSPNTGLPDVTSHIVLPNCLYCAACVIFLKTCD